MLTVEGRKPTVGPCRVPEGRSGAWAVERFEVPAQSIERLRIAMSGRLAPDPGTYTRLTRGGYLVMSDTIAELNDLWPFESQLERLRARDVLINGLGLGCALQMALAVDSVKRVVVVEKSPDVIKLVGPSFVDKRVEIIEADAYTIEWPRAIKWDVAWHDIWDDISEDNLPLMAKLHRKYGRRVKWQGSWCKYQILARRRRGGRMW